MTEGNEKLKIMLVMAAVCESIMEGDAVIGTPGGILYVALMSHGMTMNGFNTLMEGLINAGAITKHGQCYRITPLGVDFVASANRVSKGG